MEKQVLLQLNQIEKSFGETQVLKGISLTVYQGEFITLLGSSGCGKTTTLRIIAGLETPDNGSILLEGQDVTEIAPNHRDVNTVFQSYALFPHMNVAANIAYSLKIRNTPKAEIAARVKEILELVQLEGYEKRMPSELSGGQKQRVAIARALINRPKLLLLDEPLGALDLQLRRQMQLELKRLQKKLGLTFIYITHDQEEALNMSDRIVVMEDGRFEQIGTPSEVYDAPRTSFVAKFVGTANLIEGTVTSSDGRLIQFQNQDGSGSFLTVGHKFAAGDTVTLAVRAEQTHITLDTEDERGAQTGICGIVNEKNFAGGMLRIAVKTANDNEIICSRQGIDSALATGDHVVITWLPEHCVPVDLQESEAFDHEKP
ncbi:ABC transporter ATP-binding protein [Scatolibacter rhodanostii]|uniref:ABC transporter ATP-binding protein n=1 Tax=Scatolibacter rhodanostii TaxID=2014781 RepID=UPI000C07298A|nr:ABC transporter ATP-binding protein [Scatolibacter rhodanostii]